MSDISDIDPNIRGMAAMLDRIGMVTKSSCGGHANPKPGQAKEGEWYVCFILPAGDQYSYSVAYLIRLFTALQVKGVNLEIKFDGGYPICFLRGAGSDPQEIYNTLWKQVDQDLAAQGQEGQP